MKNITGISVKEALDRLSLPVFYSDDERMVAYYVIMESGTLIDKAIAEKIVGAYPLEEFLMLSTQTA